MSKMSKMPKMALVCVQMHKKPKEPTTTKRTTTTTKRTTTKPKEPTTNQKNQQHKKWILRLLEQYARSQK